MNDRHVGTCSLCGGRVMLPSIWHSVIPPEPTCERCHATAAPPELPVMKMRPQRNAIRLPSGELLPTRSAPDSNPMHRFGYGRGDDE
jgi:hypothetical protein